MALVLAVLLTLGLIVSATARAAFSPRTIDFSFSTKDEPVFFDPADGDEVTLAEAVARAAGEGLFDLRAVDRVGVYNGKMGSAAKNINFSGDEIRQPSGKLPAFRFAADETTMVLPDGTEVVYDTARRQNPSVTVELSQGPTVRLGANARVIEPGQTVVITATVKGALGNLSYRWDFGDGTGSKAVKESVKHRFKDRSGEFNVVLAVTDDATGLTGYGAVRISVQKKEKKPERKPKKPERNVPPPAPTGTGGPASPGGSGPGGRYGGYPSPGGSGGGTGGPSSKPSRPATPAPAPRKRKKPTPTLDDGLVPVRGELLDPELPTRVLDPATGSPGDAGTTPYAEAAPGGFALSGEAKTALGIAALLGLGGLAELRSFSRFR